MHAQVSMAATWRWPLPPFFSSSEGSPPSDDKCLVEFNDGHTLLAELLTFEPDRNTICVRVPDQASPEQLDLEQMRLLKLSTPRVLVLDAEVIRNVGASEADLPGEMPFVVSFRDHQILRGWTRGFIKDKTGLFLFLLSSDPRLTTHCFIPAQQLENVQIGPRLGEMLANKNLVSGKILDAALSKQAALRQELLGTQLAERAIVLEEDLKRALHTQRQLPKMKLGDILLDAGAITREQLAEALRIQAERRGRKLGDILVEMGAVTVQLVLMVLSDKLGIPYVNVRDFRIDPLTLGLMSQEVATKYQALPLLCVDESLVVAVENPLAMDFASDVSFATGMTIVPVIANPDDLRRRISKEYSSYERIYAGRGSGVPDPDNSEAGDRVKARLLSKERIEDVASELSRSKPLLIHSAKDVKEESTVTDNALVRLVNKIIVEAHAQGASDIHIESNPGKAATRIRFRHDGDLEDYLDLQPVYRNALVSRIKIMAGLDTSEHRHAQDGKIDFVRYGPLPIELRVAIIPTANGLEDVVMRILGGMEPMPIDKLGLAERDLKQLKQMISHSYGLILVVGPTGSGKTTTLHSLLHDINRPDIKIWTAEDPVEITQPGLRQVQINSKIDWTFATAMRAFLRADPDVIMVGEMRDVETTKIGIEASLTGHLVFSTLHTNSAAESVVRLLELGMDPFNFADALIGILSQRLARKLCPKCKRAHVASESEISALLEEYCAGSTLEPTTVLAQWHSTFSQDGKLLLHEAVGCAGCKDGYRGRVGVYELLAGSSEIKQLIRAHGTVPQLVDAAQASGMRLLRQDAIEKVLCGLLDLSSARAASS